MRDLARNFASTHQAENPRDTSEANWRQQFSEVGKNKQLFIAIVPVAQVLFESKFEIKVVLKNTINLNNNNLSITKNQDNSLFLEI
ncbi:MAG: hypothetical protein CMP12_07865 [Zunongwangia sp.]|uniref:Uncharacterized protein n=1 Tax=Zunongwangia profunda (strain DSM 18752 / CCTCC AB 206139 / SM-A87) TaxID=655815 RepID=D5BIW1_ZUNPS|nr:hypothetical protein ZPR_3278 [Zunongwangia profunda SM-A87]MAO35813.1 hypothetical protein [Zunongwangia sp.]MAS71249.1 hypothetical protein [Zunongwangia sp.]